MVCCPTHHYTWILNPSPLSKHPSPLTPHPSPLPTRNLSVPFFFQQQFPMKRAYEIKGNSNAVFWFHFWHPLISNLNGYQEKISAYLPPSFCRVLMQMRPICYIEWRCLVLKNADSLCEKSFSPANDKDTKWETTQAWEGSINECYHTG